MFIREDFPAPFSPVTACTSPLRTVRLTPSRACTPEKDFDSSRASSIAAIRLRPPGLRFGWRFVRPGEHGFGDERGMHGPQADVLRHVGTAEDVVKRQRLLAVAFVH